MKEYRHGAHSVFEIHLPLVRTTQYRQRVLGRRGGDDRRQIATTFRVFLETMD